MSVTVKSDAAGAWFYLHNQKILRGYGGDRSEVAGFKAAIDSGVKFFDGAYCYHDAPKLREAVVDKGVTQFVLASKIPSFKLDINDLAGSTERCFDEIMAELGVAKLDILYLHGPDCVHKEVLDVLVRLKNEGRIEHIGLCSVAKRTLEATLKAKYPITVVQNEVNPYYWDEEVLQFCHENEIVVVGFSPYGNTQHSGIFQEEPIKNIALRVNSTVQAVILKWLTQNGVTPIPQSNTLQHIADNTQIPAWSLTGDEMKKINAIKQGKTATCELEPWINKDLMAKSQEWVNGLSGHG